MEGRFEIKKRSNVFKINCDLDAHPSVLQLNNDLEVQPSQTSLRRPWHGPLPKSKP